jgi:hypothetical protein
MQLGGYFVSDESEKAAIGDAFQRYQEATRRADLLTIEMGKIGKELGVLADALQHPRAFSLLLESSKLSKLTIGRPNAALTRPLSELPESYLNWDKLHRLIVDYQEAVATKTELSGLLGIK